MGSFSIIARAIPQQQVGKRRTKEKAQPSDDELGFWVKKVHGDVTTASRPKRKRLAFTKKTRRSFDYLCETSLQLGPQFSPEIAPFGRTQLLMKIGSSNDFELAISTQ